MSRKWQERLEGYVSWTVTRLTSTKEGSMKNRSDPAARVFGLCLATILIFNGIAARGQTQPAGAGGGSDATTVAIGAMRAGLIDSFARGDIDKLVSYLASDVVVTWQNGEVSHGPDGVKAYYLKMMKGDQAKVAKIESDPQVDGRQINGDWAVSYGHMNDRFTLTDGTVLALNSRFTALISRQGNRWFVNGFHLSVDAFDNPMLGYAEKKSATVAGVGAGVGGIVLGLVIGMAMARRRKKTIA
jgi:ketosteroid isomerase-like protein